MIQLFGMQVLEVIAKVLTTQDTLPIVSVFAAGLLAFFSPCVLPIVPLYMGYLSGGATMTAEDSDAELKRQQRRTLLNTLFFVFGISFAYMILGIMASSAGQWFQKYGSLISRIGGGLVIVIALLQIYNHFSGKSLGSEKRFKFDLEKYSMNPVTALILGFTFSFAWTPCIGPILVSVIAMVANAATQAKGLGLMLIYTLGFTLPFIALGFFTKKVLAFFREKRGVMRYTQLVGAILMLVMGILLVTGVLG